MHSGIMGPFRCPDLDGHRYNVTLYYQFTGYGEVTEVFLMTHNSEVNVILRLAVYRWQRRTNRKVRCIRTDRGKEYAGKFQRFLHRDGIVHRTSTPYTPEQNAAAKRYNRSLLEKTRALLNEHQTTNLLWGDAIKTAAHIRNLMPRTGQHLSPFELLFDKKPSGDHLKIFVCTVHIPRKLRDKTDPVSKKGLFVGYAEFSRAWRVLIWHFNKFVVMKSASVIFAKHLSTSMQSLKGAPTGSNTPDIESDTGDASFYAGLVQLPPEAA
jgi:hypothetical protein